jgi:hypothetical protein
VKRRAADSIATVSKSEGASHNRPLLRWAAEPRQGHALGSAGQMIEGNAMSVLAILALLNAAAVATPALPFDLSARTVVATFHAEGAQLYQCKAKPGGSELVWTFREPIAALMENGETIGRHFAGPRWELDDGSVVQARMTQSMAGPTPSDIPMLKLDVIQHKGHGRLDQVTTVYRLDTHSGALQGACSTPGAFRSIPYSAEYVFAR